MTGRGVDGDGDDGLSDFETVLRRNCGVGFLASTPLFEANQVTCNSGDSLVKLTIPLSGIIYKHNMGI